MISYECIKKYFPTFSHDKILKIESSVNGIRSNSLYIQNLIHLMQQINTKKLASIISSYPDIDISNYTAKDTASREAMHVYLGYVAMFNEITLLLTDGNIIKNSDVTEYAPKGINFHFFNLKPLWNKFKKILTLQ